MKYSKLKIVAITVSVAAIAGLIFIALNGNYFFKQLKFLFHKPNVAQDQANNPNNESDKAEPNQISIPSLGIAAPVVESNGNDESSFQESLKIGVVHYPGTAEVGQLGNAYLFGHSSDLAFKDGDYKTVFALLPSIEKGAEIRVSDSSGNIFRYVVIDSFVANSDDVQLLDQKEYKEKLLTLQTSYPIGTALKRWIVVAKLEE